MNPVFQRLLLIGSLVAGPAHAADGALSSLQASCTISISGVEVDLGRTTLAQCTSYARSSLLDKAEVKTRVVRHGDAWLRISATAIESSPDAGKSWLPAQDDARPTLGGLAAMGRIAPAVDSAVTASVPAPLDKVPSQAAPPAPAGAAAAEKTKNQEKPKPAVTATMPAPAPAFPMPPSAAAPVVSQPSVAVVTTPVAAAPASKAMTQQEACDYKQDGRWRSLAAGSLTECVEKIRSKFESIPDFMGEGYWAGTFIALASARVYVSSDGKEWSELTR